ncbi:class I SAM-dependent methyltransferase [Frigidibacter sp.]|uniref:class I SAM-dependent methyltransferase n=1 Tax=Frigidibacter sp. TaxID=2586418 RepID=UPI0027363FDA|nr:class I SAM-dependent methyltransferase [Frigidibacter sp.]MDP3338749.1 class I SAM-dependent methyltransferase [Frigidibacter sp.]
MRDAEDRFDGLAEQYEMHRPGYPLEAFRALTRDIRCCTRIAVDVGAGPGNSTLSLREAIGPGWSIVAIEPGRDMRRVLARRFSAAPEVQVSDATAEEMHLPSGFASLVVACTAFHWLDAPRFFAEAERILAPGGVLGLIRNRRKPSPVVQAFDRYIEEQSGGISDIALREARKEPVIRDLAQVPGFMAARSCTYAWESHLTARGLIDLYLTRSTLWAVVRRIGLTRVMADLNAICAAQKLGDTPQRIEWETTAKWARKRSA